MTAEHFNKLWINEKKKKKFAVMKVIEELSIFPLVGLITIGSNSQCSCCQKNIYMIKKCITVM